MSHSIKIAAGSAALLFGAASGVAMAQVAGPSAGAAMPGAPAGQPSTGPSAERAGLALPTEAANLFARDRNVSVLQRPKDGYEALGLRAGAFLVYPKLSATAEYNDNIYATEDSEIDDLVWRVAPEISAASNWSRHSLSAYARAVFNRFQDNEDENSDDFLLGVNGRLDLLRFTNVRTSLDWAQLTEPRTSPNNPTLPPGQLGGALEPTQYELTSLRVDAEHTVNRLRFTGRYAFQQFDYDNPPRQGGGVIDQQYRDRDVNMFSGRVDFAVSPASALFIEVIGNTRDYRLPGNATAVNRDSDGVQVLGGANFELGSLSRGEVAVGYLKQKFEDPRLRTVDGFGARAQVEWFPTPLTTVTASGSRTIEDSSVPGSGAYLSSNLGLQVDHELLRNVIISGRASYGEDKYDFFNRKDERQSAGVSATYLLNRSIGLTASYSYDRRDTVRGTGTDFIQNKVAATLTAQF
ncbi:outer membrane beta-barrel protein [Phenylobacterium sp.]|uniref:outer membrane beta-barrel protein n=1 Tax=Phenylobacterium sp. TaxID=1871053 RepID=UPI002F928724